MKIVRIFNAHHKYRRRHNETIHNVLNVLRGEKHSNAEINVIFCDDKLMVKLNTSYLFHTYPTDVISFFLSDPDETAVVGEIYINIDQADRQAIEYHESLSTELGRLVIHGVLHLLGYNDKSVRQKRRMVRLENKYLKNIN